MYKRPLGERIFSVFNYMFLTVIAITTLYPLIYTITMSLSTTSEALKSGFHLFPKEITLDAYSQVFSNNSFSTAYFNTVFRTVVGTSLALLVTLMFAYALSRSYLPNKKVYTMILLFTMIFNGGQIPTYLVIKDLHLLDNIWVYILPNLLTAYNVIIAKSFFQSIPTSLTEAAKIDGANEFVIFFKLMLPLSLPVIMTLMLWIGVFHWNAWFDSMIYITDNNKIVAQLLLQRIIQAASQTVNMNDAESITLLTSETVKSATIIVTVLPILAIYPFIQKYFMSGVMLGAVKE